MLEAGQVEAQVVLLRKVKGWQDVQVEAMVWQVRQRGEQSVQVMLVVSVRVVLGQAEMQLFSKRKRPEIQIVHTVLLLH